MVWPIHAFEFSPYSTLGISLSFKLCQRLYEIMKSTIVTLLAAFIYQCSASVVPSTANLNPRTSCENTATTRSCWGDYSIDTDYYTVVPDTGVTRGAD